MFFKRLFWVSFFILMTLAMLAADYSVKGRLISPTGETEPFATIRIYSDADTVKPVTLGTSGEEGTFLFSLKADGKYRLNVTAVGKSPADVAFELTAATPAVNLGDITLQERSTELAELTVVAQKPLVTKEIDRIGYDVQGDEEAKTSNVSDILRKVPLVTVEDDGTIKVKGSSDFRIYKNGRPNTTMTKNAKDIFKAIPASTIKKIEVITDPGAREDAEGVGAILNIVTLQETSVKGVMGSLSLHGSNQQYIPSPFLWLMSQIDKVTFSVNGGYFSGEGRMFKSRSETDYTYDSNGNHMSQISVNNWRRSRFDGYFIGTEASYDIDSLNLLTAEFSGYSYKSRTPSISSTLMTDVAGDLLYSYDANNVLAKNSYLDFSGSVNFQHSTRRPDEKITLSYMLSTSGTDGDSKTEYENMVNPLFDYIGITAWSRERFMEHTGQLDWTRPINQMHKFDLGGKFIFRDNHSKGERDYVGRPENSLEPSNYSHRMSIGAAYFDWRTKINKVSLRAGLRYEFSRLTSRDKLDANNNFSANLSDWVPMAAVNYNINDAHTVKFSYSTRISRPGISQLNPTVNRSPNQVSYGNPDLESALYHTLSLNYNLIKPKFNSDLSLSYNMSNNGVNPLSWVETSPNGEDIIYNTYGNIGRTHSVNLSGYFRWMISDKTSWTLNLSGSYGKYKYPSVGLEAAGWETFGYTQIRQQLPGKFSAELGCFGWYDSFAGMYSKSDFSAANIHYTLSLNRSFLKEDRLNLRLSFRNAFGPYSGNRVSHPINTGITGSISNREFNRFGVSLSVSYRFGQLNAYVKKVDRSASNDDLNKSRPGNSNGGM